jgi:2-polyprenyl-6-methoxyphenol hydroxylase-like FAD-dependent oxidoreductase
MKVVICGAGIAGLTLAHRMSTLDWDVVVLEKAPGPRAQGYMIDFFGPGYDAAKAMGALPWLEEHAYEVQEARYLDETGRRRAAIRYAQFTKALGGRALSIMRPDIERALREHLPDSVDLRFAIDLRDIDSGPDQVRVTLSDDSTLEADLLVGADGIHSTVRRMVFGEDRLFFRYLGFHTAAFVFTDPDIQAQVRGRFCLTDTTNRQMAFYGLRDGRVAVFAVHRTPDPVLPEDPRAALRREYASLGWVVPRALAQCPPAAQIYYDQVAQIEMPQWTHGRVTLIGDACQAVSLLAGQGASLAIGGAYVLADQLTRAGSIDAGLQGYERLWRPVVTDKQRVARSMTRWFLPEYPWQLRVRRIAVKLSRLPGLDRAFAATLAGKPSTLITQLRAAPATGDSTDRPHAGRS